MARIFLLKGDIANPGYVDIPEEATTIREAIYGIGGGIPNGKKFKAVQIGGKLSSVPALQAEYEKLQAQKESLYADYGKLKKQVQEYDVIKRNIDSILQAEKQPERERQTERG